MKHFLCVLAFLVWLAAAAACGYMAWQYDHRGFGFLCVVTLAVAFLDAPLPPLGVRCDFCKREGLPWKK